MTEPIPIVIDTDVGTDVDDALAIALALASPEVDLIGVTIVDGDVDLRARIAARLLGMAERPDIPVLRGASRPLGPGRMPTMRGHEGRGILDVDYRGPEARIGDEDAAQWLSSTAAATPFHLVAIGPYTNVATALRDDPQLARRLLGLTVMGGMVHEDGYVDAWKQYFRANGIDGAWLDHNTASDPEAALLVARTGARMTWVTVELTFCLPLHATATERLAGTGTELGGALARMLRIWNDEWFRHTASDHVGPDPFPPDATAFLHDPLALAALFPGDWLTLREEQLAYSIEDSLFRIRPSVDGEQRARVSVADDAPAFERFFLDRVLGLLETLRGA